MSMKEEVRNMKLSAPEMASSAAEVRDRVVCINEIYYCETKTVFDVKKDKYPPPHRA